MCSGWLKPAKLLELTNNRGNKDYRRVFQEFGVVQSCSTARTSE